MKTLLQNIKDALSKVFPLHLNRTYADLEERLASAEFGLYCRACQVEFLKEEIDDLTRTNNAYRQENMHLSDAVRHYQQELENEWKKQYRSFVPQVEAQTARDMYLDVVRLCIDIPAFRMVTAHDPRHLSDSYIDYFANRLANDVAAASAAKTKEVLLNARCKGI